MTTGTHLSPVVFRCPSCSGVLSIPVEQAGIAGPCPFCQQNIRSPEGAHRQTPAHSGSHLTQQQHHYQQYPVPTRDPVSAPERESPSAKNRMLAIARTWRLDESWKGRHRDLARRFSKKQKWESFFSRLLSKETGIALAAIFATVMVVVVFRHYDNRNKEPVRQLERMDSFVEGGSLVSKPAPSPSVNWNPANGFTAEKAAARP